MIATTSGRMPVGTWITAALLALVALLGAGPGIANAAATTPAQSGWVDVTDAPSGVTVALPGEADPVEVPFGRAYAPDGADVAFAVVDVPTIPGLGLDTVLDSVGPGLGVTVVESQETTVDGRDALDAVVAVDREDAQGTALVRAVLDDGHVIVLATRATDASDETARALHQRLLAGLRFA
ncbi:MAG: hypothetical protein AB7V44_34425 [Pseudonocardia sp.]